MLPYATLLEIHQYARQLVSAKAYQDAFDAFQMNYRNNPGNFTTVVGMVRGYSALGDFKNALKFANMALPLAPDANNKTFLQGMIDKLKTGKDIN